MNKLYRLKPLVWEGPTKGWWTALPADMEIHQIGGNFILYDGGFKASTHDTAEKAKEAADKRYMENMMRILMPTYVEEV
jgi:hypothetical protein